MLFALADAAADAAAAAAAAAAVILLSSAGDGVGSGSTISRLESDWTFQELFCVLDGKNFGR